jgi:hypothetical protein
MRELIAGVIAAILAFAELKQSLGGLRIPFMALGWVAARLVLDAIGASVLYPILQTATHMRNWPEALLPIVFAGLGAPAVLRGDVVVGNEGKRYGIGGRYQRWLKIVTDKISDVGCVAQSKWLWNKVVPKIIVFDIPAVRNRSLTYLKARQSSGHMTNAQVRRFETYTAKVEADAGTSRQDRIAVIAQMLLDIGGRRCVAQLVRDSRGELRRQKGVATRLQRGEGDLSQESASEG